MEQMYWIVLAMIVFALVIGVLIGIMAAPPYVAPDMSNVQMPIKPLSTADIERRKEPS